MERTWLEEWKCSKRNCESLHIQYFSATKVTPWNKKRLYLDSAELVHEGSIDVPQTEVIHKYFSAANTIDIHNQYCQGILAIKLTWKTQNWEIRIFQSLIEMILINGYLAFKSLNIENPTLKEFTCKVAIAMCTSKEVGSSFGRHQV